MSQFANDLQCRNMKAAYSSAISTAFAVTDTVSSHVVVFTAYQFSILFVALVALSVFLVKAYNKRRSRTKRISKSRCVQAIEYPSKPTKPKFQDRKISQHKRQEAKEVRPKLSRKARKRLRATASDKKAPLPVPSLTQEPDRDDILKAIKNVSNQHVLVESKEKKATRVKKARKMKKVASNKGSFPVVAAAASTFSPAVVGKTDACSKVSVVSQNVETRKPRRPQRRPITLKDYILRRDMRLNAYVQTYKV